MLYVTYFSSTGYWSKDDWEPPLGGANVVNAMVMSDGIMVMTMPGTSVTLGFAQWIAWLCVPVALFKNVVNVIQLVTACIDIANCDLKQRAEQRAAARGNQRSRSPSSTKRR